MIGPIAKELIMTCGPENSKEDLIMLLSKKASSNLPGVGEGSEWVNLIDRIQLGIIRMSNWEPDAVAKMINEAQTDYRDLLMNAGFGESLLAHIEWSTNAIKTCSLL